MNSKKPTIRVLIWALCFSLSFLSFSCKPKRPGTGASPLTVQSGVGLTQAPQVTQAAQASVLTEDDLPDQIFLVDDGTTETTSALEALAAAATSGGLGLDDTATAEGVGISGALAGLAGAAYLIFRKRPVEVREPEIVNPTRQESGPIKRTSSVYEKELEQEELSVTAPQKPKTPKKTKADRNLEEEDGLPTARQNPLLTKKPAAATTPEVGIPANIAGCKDCVFKTGENGKQFLFIPPGSKFSGVFIKNADGANIQLTKVKDVESIEVNVGKKSEVYLSGVQSHNLDQLVKDGKKYTYNGNTYTKFNDQFYREIDPHEVSVKRGFYRHQVLRPNAKQLAFFKLKK